MEHQSCRRFKRLGHGCHRPSLALFDSSPRVLHVNQESRTECLKFYTLSFGIERTGINFTLPAQIYVNWSSEKVCFMSTFSDYSFAEVMQILKEIRPSIQLIILL